MNSKNAYMDILKDGGLIELIEHYRLTSDDVTILVMSGIQMQIVKAGDGGLDVVLNPNGTINRVTVGGYLLNKTRASRLEKLSKQTPEVA